MELLYNNLTLEREVGEKSKRVLDLQNIIMKTIAELVERRDSVTGGHIDRTRRYLARLVELLMARGVYSDEISGWNIDLLLLSSQLHDVGKIGIRDVILMKPGRLNPEEFEEMKKHCVMGVDIISQIEETGPGNEFLDLAKVMAGTHHEKWDGSGYPYGLKGAGIPLQGRLMAIVDVYDALTNERPYKKALTHEESINIIKGRDGKPFRPACYGGLSGE